MPQEQHQHMPGETALFDQRYSGGERPSVGSSVSSSVCSDGEWVDGSVVLESAEQLARQVNEAWEYATEVASRPVTAASDLRSPAAAPSVPRRRRCSKEAMLSAELAGGATQLTALSAAAPGISLRRLRSAGAAAASGGRPGGRTGESTEAERPAQPERPASTAGVCRPAWTAGRPGSASVVTQRIPLIHLQASPCSLVITPHLPAG